MKKCLDICHVTQMYQKSWPNDHILNCSWDTRHDRCNFYFSFWDIFCPVPPLTTQKNKLKQIWRKKLTWRYQHFTHVHQKFWSQWFLKNMVRSRWADRQADRKSDIQRWVSHLKNSGKSGNLPSSFLTNLDM